MNCKIFTREEFIKRLDNIVEKDFGCIASNSKFIIVSNYDSRKSSTGEDDYFRMVILSENNVGGKVIDYQTVCEVLTIFSPHYPTKIIIKRKNDMNDTFEIICSTRLRKPSEITGISSDDYIPFVVEKD